MKIKELNLIGFGKFNNKVIELTDGINLIYGENESGKTTIHNFIDGMFYGFLKPYAKRTIYLDEHAKYTPWNNNKYAGILRFIHNGKAYRIERVFTKGREETIILLEDTGDDITQSIDMGDGGRVLQPGFHFFGFNDAVYSNTVSIKQLESKTEALLANEVRDKLVNVSTTLDDNLSVEKALEELYGSLKEIGTIRATTSIYGRTHMELERLRMKRKEILQNKEEYDYLLKEDTELEKLLEIKYREFDSLGNRLNDAIILEQYNIYKEAILLNNSIKELEKRANSLKKYEYLSMEEYNEARELYLRIDYLKERYEELRNSILEIDNKIKKLEEYEVRDMDINPDISQDYMNYEELEERKNKELYTARHNEIEFLKRDYEHNQKSKSMFKFILILSIILSLGSILLKVINFGTIQLWFNIITMPLIILMIHRIKKIEELLSRIQLRKEDIELKEKERLDGIMNIEKLQISILEKYNVSSKLEFKKLYDNSRILILRDNTREEEYQESHRTRKDILDKIQEIKIEKNNKVSILREILEKNSCQDIEDFKENLKNKAIYDNLLLDIRSKKDLMERILGKFTLEELEKEIEDYPKDIANIDKNYSTEEIKKKIDLTRDEISNIKIEKKGIEERINILNREISNLVEIDEEIQRKENKIEKLDKKRASIGLAINTIEELSKDIHRQFAPTINRKVGEIVQEITGGKYKGVRINDNLEIGIINPITREIIDINSLSGGTIDQLYFSLRFGIIDSIKNQGLPLILDDCFIQYDDSRLKNMMDFLVSESKNRQIILFTCHKREKEVLNKMDVDFNLISLT